MKTNKGKNQYDISHYALGADGVNVYRQRSTDAEPWLWCTLDLLDLADYMGLDLMEITDILIDEDMTGSITNYIEENYASIFQVEAGEFETIPQYE